MKIIYIIQFIITISLANPVHHHKYGIQDDWFWIFTIIAVALSMLAGFCSGATQGLLSIDMLSLELKMKSGTPDEKQYAQVILPVIQQHHLLLSTLLVGNALACETLPIMLHQIAPDWLAILISSVIIVLFGEIIPSAFTTGPDQLYIGMRMIPFVKIMQSILYIIVYPLGLILDCLLGVNHNQRYRNKDIRGLLKLHVQDHQLSKDQMKLMESMMDLRYQPVTQQAKDIKKVFMVSVDERFSAELRHKIKVKGFSRIPLYQGQDRDQIVGTFNAKSILKLSAQDYGRPLAQLVQIQEPLIVPQDTTMLEMLIIFQQKRKTVALISKVKKPKEHADTNKNFRDAALEEVLPRDTVNLISLLSLTDVFEEMLDVEIEDEDIHGTLRDYPKHKQKYIELGVIHEEVEKGLETKLLNKG